MGRKALSEDLKLHMVGGAVSAPVKVAIEKIALAANRSVSHTVRKLLEESPRIKAALREAKKNGSRKGVK
jgi:hypothetical protein